MSIQVQATTDGLQEVVGKLQNPKPLLDRIGQYLVSTTQARIRSTKTSPDGTPWAPWKPGTYLARAKRGALGGGVLYDTGNLFSSITYTVGPDSVEVGTAAPYARFLQQGTPRMAARPFLGISQDDETAIAAIIRRHLGA